MDADAIVTEATTGVAARKRVRVNARRGLRMREGAGTHFDVVGSVAYGSEVWVLAERGDWCQIDEEGDGRADGFCHRDYLVPVA